jgi:hypothetical protein
MKTTTSPILILLFVFTFFSCKSATDTEQENNSKSESSVSFENNEEAVNSALEWLALVDAGKYAESYDDAASMFQKALSRDKWIETLNGLLPQYGKVIKREVNSSKYYSELPGAPAGEYVVIQFGTSFENKDNCIETVTPMKDKGKWKVSGYFIK